MLRGYKAPELEEELAEDDKLTLLGVYFSAFSARLPRGTGFDPMPGGAGRTIPDPTIIH